jgi:hypothetical protein
MGQGRFKSGKFDLVVVANFAMAVNDWIEWERTIKKASEILFNASEGQMEFGRIFVCDDSVGLDTAEFILHPTGETSYGTWGLFGTPGAALHLMPYVKTRGPLTILHEMGHHVWNLGDEYSAPYISDEIDRSSPAPDNHTIPIIDTGRAIDELVGSDAILKFGDLIERHNVISNTATTVTVDANFSDLPTNSDSDKVKYQRAAECSDGANSNYCIMGSVHRAITIPIMIPSKTICMTSLVGKSYLNEASFLLSLCPTLLLLVPLPVGLSRIGSSSISNPASRWCWIAQDRWLMDTKWLMRSMVLYTG